MPESAADSIGIRVKNPGDVPDTQARLHFAAKAFTANFADSKTAEMDKWLASIPYPPGAMHSASGRTEILLSSG